MTDLVIFVGLVAVVIVVGVLVGMIVAGRIDRVRERPAAIAPDQTTPPSSAQREEDQP